MVAHNLGDPTLPSDLCGTRHVCSTHTGKTSINTELNKPKKNQTANIWAGETEANLDGLLGKVVCMIRFSEINALKPFPPFLFLVGSQG